MIILLTISDSRWEYLLQAKEDDLGRFYVYLSDSQGNRVKHSAVQGGLSLEVITHNAHSLYNTLVEMKRRAMAIRMERGLAAAAAGYQLRAGDPRFDDSHPKF